MFSDIKLLIATLLSALFFLISINSIAGVHVGSKENGVTTVTCDTECTFEKGVFNTVTVCDSDGVCVTIKGKVRDGRDHRDEE